MTTTTTNEVLLQQQQELINKFKQELVDAREHGDLSENSEFEIAQYNLWLAQVRMEELRKMGANQSQLDELEVTHYRVERGATVQLKDLDTGEIETYVFVSKELMDPFQNRLSTDCPLYKAIKGLSVGDEAVVRTSSVNRLSIEAIY